MSELDDIRARAKERRECSPIERVGTLKYLQQVADAEADLDRAIAIAEDYYSEYEAANDDALIFRRELDGLRRERDQARADVSKLRAIVRQTQYELDHHKRESCNCNGCTSLIDTEHYEQYRP